MAQSAAVCCPAQPASRWFGRLRRENRQGHILVCVMVWSLLSFVLVNRFVYSSVVIAGASMSPALVPGDRLILNRWSQIILPYQRGDIVVLRDRRDGTEVVKRIVGLPNEEISFRQGAVYVDGKRLSEPYLPAGARTHRGALPQGLLVLGPEEYFVLGDNRRSSEDSRLYGPVRRTELLGRVGPWL